MGVCAADAPQVKRQDRNGRYVPVSDPIPPFDEAVATKVKVVCKWYSKHGYEFTYDGPVDLIQYSMEFALGLLPLTLPDESGRLSLCDPAQGPMCSMRR